MRLIVVAALVGCGSPKSPPSDLSPLVATPGEARSGERAPVPVDAPPPRPDGTAALEELFRAWHVEDLPDAETLAAHPAAPEALAWLAHHGEPLVMRVRALQALAHIQTPDATALLIAVASDPSAHASVRAGAVTGLGGHLASAEARAVVERSVSDADLRVRDAAERALARP